MRDYAFLLAELEGVLGKSKKAAGDNHAFHCPFCNHHKPKLEVNLNTTDEGKNRWNCWVCNTRGTTIFSLLKQLKLPKDHAQQILKFVHKGEYSNYNESAVKLELPKEYQPLYSASTTSVVANTVKKYLYDRGLTDIDFIKYQIGYATTGEYGGRIIIPSYDRSNNLNYFVARSFEGSFYKYRNPSSSKDVIFFENLINWDQPIIICEGVFDAIAIRRNAVPILGNTLSKSLQIKIATSSVSDIYIALDKDALDKALKYSEQLLNLGKRVFLVELDEKDPSEMGFVQFTKHIQTAQELTLSSLMMHKLQII